MSEAHVVEVVARLTSTAVPTPAHSNFPPLQFSAASSHQQTACRGSASRRNRAGAAAAMEKQLSTLRDEFQRCTRRSGRRHLVLSDLLSFSHSLPLRDLSHIAVVWCLDRSRSGRISLDDLLVLAETLLARSRQFQSFEREAQLQASNCCCRDLWR